MATLSGVWVFNETLTGVDSHFSYYVKFISNGTSYTEMRCYATGSDLSYYTSSYKSVYNRGWQSEAYRTVDFGTDEQTVSDEFYTWFTANAVGETAEEPEPEEPETVTQYLIRSDTLTAIADAIRAKKETTALFSPEQMAAEIESLAMGNDLPNAEDDYFGTQNGYEYGLLSGTFGQSFTQDLNMGMVFTPTETFGFYGFRVYSCQSGASIVMNLYDDETKETLATLTRTPDVAEAWVDYAITEPINLIAGKRYMVAYRTKYWKKGNSDFTYNSKITFSKYLYYYESSYPQWPCHNAGVDMLIGEVIGASVTPEYKIQLETITEIADEIRRISGVTGTITTAQMLSTLQSIQLQDKSVIPSAEVQTITPDDGYYGLSSVMVGAIDSTITSLPDAEEAEF